MAERFCRAGWSRTTSQLGTCDNHNRDRDDGDCQEHARARAEAVEPSAHRSTNYMCGTLPEVPNGPILLSVCLV